MTKLGFVLSLMLGGSLLVAACGSTSINEGAEPSGGAGGGAGEPNGGTGATDPGGCTQHSDCKSFGDCQTLVDLKADCQHGNDDFVRYASQCGGTYVEQDGGVTGSTWVFDAEGKQIGGSYEDEGSCSEWGSQCGPTGPGTPLCSDECELHATCVSPFGCPATLDDVPDCSVERSVEVVRRQRSGCGGTLVYAGNAVEGVTWTFDADDKLVATRTGDDTGTCRYWGTECDQPAVGTSEIVCAIRGEGGMGGQGSAGAGVGGEGGGGAGGTAGAGGSD